MNKRLEIEVNEDAEYSSGTRKSCHYTQEENKAFGRHNSTNGSNI